MKRVLMLAPVVWLVCAGATAPPAAAAEKPQVLHKSSQPNACPVSFHAQQAADGEVVDADKGRPEGPAQRLHLIVDYPASGPITRARVTVHGLSPRARITPAQARPDDPTDVSRTLDIRFHPEPDGKSGSADFWVSGLTSVRTIDVEAVTFANGLSLRLKGQSACSFGPDPLMLIANQ